MSKECAPKIEIAAEEPEFGSISAIGKIFFRSNPLIKFAAKFAKAADKYYMTPDLCLINLSRRVGEVERSHDRSNWFGGRIYNKLTGSDPCKVLVSGAVLKGTLHYIGKTVPNDFDVSLEYHVRLDVARNLLAEFKNIAKAEGVIK